MELSVTEYAKPKLRGIDDDGYGYMYVQFFNGLKAQNMTRENVSNEEKGNGVLADVSGCHYRVVKHRLPRYSVEIDGKLLGGIFRLKKDAAKHMRNLIKVTNAINGCH